MSFIVYLWASGGGGKSLLSLPSSGDSFDGFGPDTSELLPSVPCSRGGVAVAIVVAKSYGNLEIEENCN